jgi:hypothetical protein
VIILILYLEHRLTERNTGLWNFLVARFTPQMFSTMGYGVYFFFAMLMIISVIFVWFFIPETKGIPLEAMDKLFSNQLSARKAHGIIMQELKVEDEDFRRASVGGVGAKIDEAGYVMGEDKQVEYLKEKRDDSV